MLFLDMACRGKSQSIFEWCSEQLPDFGVSNGGRTSARIGQNIEPTIVTGNHLGVGARASILLRPMENGIQGVSPQFVNMGTALPDNAKPKDWLMHSLLPAVKPNQAAEQVAFAHRLTLHLMPPLLCGHSPKDDDHALRDPPERLHKERETVATVKSREESVSQVRSGL
jgi:hypothetical protein